ncbi:ABC transporter ATP-binding protein [Paenibacillus psychroresistens]|uniref:ABC transporter ATP-binding protein n=1 Tax=Paenibacillus psychroresistens TaxID=1778678 RepID=A0A6B8RUF5_9BACL|nr:ABC transporter ATP-binding protein [Paenibacillus psychroresistens]QGQ99452.1 ABC transporter ATP-binding protein [Paenibacillus psychroresistens]
MKQTGKKLFQYATYYKKTIIIALILLAFAVTAELAGPFIAKRMIDRHILGIESAWYEVTTKDAKSIPYKGALYKRADNLGANEVHGREVRILQVGIHMVFVNQPLTFEGKPKLEGSSLTITRDSESVSYPVQTLSVQELYQFYKPEFNSLLQLAVFYFILIVAASFLTYGQRYMLQAAANRIIQKMRIDVFAQIQRLPIQYFDHQPAGKIVSKITNDTEAVRDLYVQVLANFFTGVIYIVGIIAALFLLDYRLALFTIPIIPILFIWIQLYRKYASKYNHEIRERLGLINGIINETIQGMPIIRVFRQQKPMFEEFDKLNQEHMQYTNKLLNLNSISTHNLVNVIRNVAFIVLILMFSKGSFGVSTALSIGVIYAYIEYMNRMFHPIVGMLNQLANLEKALVSASRVFELLDEKGTDVVAGQMERYKGHVKFENVNFAYIEDEDVLKDISLDAQQGQTVALVGHTGSGKSSILNLLFRFYDTERGRITIDGQDIREIPKQLLRQQMGIVLQDPFLFVGTIASNVSLDDPSITREVVEKAIRDVGAEAMFSNLPLGIDEPVIEKGATLSAGQRQLISFARALAFNPAILILDEATASIDSETEAIIQSGLDVLKKGRTTFIIAHRLSTIKNADQILVLDRGKIIERGNHDSLMQQSGKYYQMYQLQQGRPVSVH